MRLFLILILLLGGATACKSKHVQFEKNEEMVSDHRQEKKEGVTESNKEQEKTTFEIQQNQSLELEIESEDSTEEKPLIIEREATPTGEKMTIKGGKARMKITENKSQSVSKIDDVVKEKEIIVTNEQTQSQSNVVKIDKKKEVKTTGFTFGFYFWLLIVVILIIVGWRIKKFFE